MPDLPSLKIPSPTEEFSGRIRVWKAPVEVVPTPDKIPHKNRYFQKRIVLIGKKPCNLAAFLSSRKTGRSIGYAERRAGWKCVYGPKIKGAGYGQKTTRFSRKNAGFCHYPAPQQENRGIRVMGCAVFMQHSPSVAGKNSLRAMPPRYFCPYRIFNRPDIETFSHLVAPCPFLLHAPRPG